MGKYASQAFLSGEILGCVYMTTQPGLRFVVRLQEVGWNQARRIQQAVFLSPAFFFKTDPVKYVTSLSNPLFTCIFQLFQPGLKSHGLSARVEISTRIVM